MLTRGLVVCVAVVIVTAGIAVAEDQDFSISKSITQLNRIPKPSIAPNGDVLIVWESGPYQSSGSAAHYTALCQLRKNGMYKVKKARMLANASRTFGSFDIAHNPEDGSWLVVWYETEGSQDFEIFSCRFIAKGKPKGGQNIIIRDKQAMDQQPVIAYLPSGPASPSVAKGGYLLVWDRYNPANLAVSGIYSVHLDADGKVVAGTQKYVRKANNVDGFASYFKNFELQRMEDGKFLLTGHSWEIRGGNSWAEEYPMLLRLGASGAFEKALLPTSTESHYARAAVLSKKYLLLLWVTGSDVRSCIVKSKTFKNKPIFTNPARYALDGKFVKLEDDPGSVFVYANGNLACAQYYDQKGSPVGYEDWIVNSGYWIDTLSAVCLPGTNNIFLTYAIATPSGTEYELRGRVVKRLK